MPKFRHFLDEEKQRPLRVETDGRLHVQQVFLEDELLTPHREEDNFHEYHIGEEVLTIQRKTSFPQALIIELNGKAIPTDARNPVKRTNAAFRAMLFWFIILLLGSVTRLYKSADSPDQIDFIIEAVFYGMGIGFSLLIRARKMIGLWGVIALIAIMIAVELAAMFLESQVSYFGLLIRGFALHFAIRTIPYMRQLNSTSNREHEDVLDYPGE